MPLDCVGNGRVLWVPRDFDVVVADLFAKSDVAGVESMCLCFRSLATESACWELAALVMVEHSGLAERCSVTDRGCLQMAEFFEDHQNMALCGWLHSHHTLNNDPSDADLQATLNLERISSGQILCGVAWNAVSSPPRGAGVSFFRLRRLAEVEEYLKHGDLNDVRTPKSLFRKVPLARCGSACVVHLVSGFY